MTKDLRCTHCGNAGLDQGFVENDAQHSSGDARWVAGPLERGLFGGAKQWGRPHFQIDAFRCPHCGHLELFARQQLG
ncbi:hypothetical protein [Kitasatospora sp. NPDC059673]|uniref:hypothetical protein n=1 Tax=Kitasatospora sp. NPDC059673 TaxID=3346901 RepID=UPI0036C8C38E